MPKLAAPAHRTTSRRACIAAGMLAMALAAPASAAPEVQRSTERGATVKLAGTNGYRATIVGFANSVSVDAHARHLGASYTTRGSVGRRSLDGDFGSFGAVHVRFIPEGDPTVRRIPFPGGFACEGTTTIRRGRWVGRVEFIPEGSFTTLSSTSARGAVHTDRIRCGSEPPDPGPLSTDDRDTQTALFVDKGPGLDGDAVSFTAFQEDGRSKAGFSVDETHVVHAIRVTNYASVSAPRRAFRVDLKRRRARVEPPPPFTGSAVFKKSPDGRGVWRGDLAVDLVSGPLPLTGAGFRAVLDPPGVILVGGT